ncbi:hypothetical protein J6590_020146 [Homalodisca vitripennis]|nr:hypothetical protein J6590_020146 [Homalodisca vitripennis]
MASDKSLKFSDLVKSQRDSNLTGKYNEHFSKIFPNSQNPFDEVGFFKQLCKSVEEVRLTNPSIEVHEDNSENKKGKNITVNDNAQCMTPKSQKPIQSNVKRWASVVKAQKNIQFSDSNVCGKKLEDGIEITSEIFNCIFKTLPKCFENHKGFITENENIFSCKICSVELESVLTLSNHLKTRKHEDNIISFFKDNLPVHIHSIMDFISFYGSNLCCNLCRCKINMSSYNTFETIVNIIAHNSDKAHADRKTDHDTFNLAHSLLDSLVASNKEIKENAHFIEKKMNPQFRCKLCNKNILYDENVEILEQNFSSHFNSIGHIKNQKAVEVLRLFGEASIGGKDSFVVINGNISCTYCNYQVETDMEKLISHVNGGEHAKKVLSVLEITSGFNKFSESKSSWLENKTNEARVLTNSNVKKEKAHQLNEKKLCLDSRLDELLRSIPPSVTNTDCIVENDKGSVTCLVCDRVVPPSSYNLRTHLLGSNHKKNQELRKSNKTMCFLPVIKSQDKENYSELINTIKNADPKNPINVNHLLQSFPNYLTKNDEGELSCLVCQCCVSLESEDLINHLTSSKHKTKERQWLKNCPVCPQLTFQKSTFIEKLPTFLRVYKCNRTEMIPFSILNHQFNLLLKKNALVSSNTKFFTQNVDGKNCYCKICKSLIPLSLDLNTLEENIVSHLKEKRHKANFSRHEQEVNVESKFEGSNTGKIVRSLFTSEECGSKDVEVIENQTKQSTEMEQHYNGFKKISEAIFHKGKENSGANPSKRLSIGKSKSAGLPLAKVSSILKSEEETSEEVLNRRQKQIDYGKNTAGYARYCEMVPQHKRELCHPITPPKYLKCSRRNWDGMIRAWRRRLHDWDPPGTALDLDIQPLRC